MLLPEEWPTNSPDLNPMDYRIWEIFENKVQAKARKGIKIEEFKALLKDVWENDVTNELIEKCIMDQKSGFHAMLKKVI